MADEKAHINYSLEDIERYLKGGMSSKEMHELEKVALQDPFLADAIEGYSNASMEQSRKHLNEITAALQNERENSKVVPLPATNFYWWRIAAVIILVVGIGAMSWYIIDLNSKTELNKVAVMQEKKNVTNDTAMKETMNDTVNSSLIAQNKSTQHSHKKRKNHNKQKSENEMALSLADTQQERAQSLKMRRDSIIVTEKNDSLQTAALSAPVQYDTSRLANRASGVDVNDERYLFSNNNALKNFNGRVIDNNYKPVPNAIISLNNKQAVYTNVSGYFTFRAPDSLQKVNISSIGYKSHDTLLKSNYANNIVIVPDKNSFSDVAVSAFATKRKAFDKNGNTDSAYPLGGWTSFNEYVYKKLGRPVDTLNDEVDSVEIEFSIDSNGVPYNFNVLKSLNDEAASKAIEIIKEGPQWISPQKNKKGKVTIRF